MGKTKTVGKTKTDREFFQALRGVIVIDTREVRERRPYKFKDMLTTVKTLKTGDYSLLGYEDIITIERKTQTDFYKSIGKDRQRFQRCLERMKDMELKYVVVESPFIGLINAGTTSGTKKKLNPMRFREGLIQTEITQASIEGTIYSIISRFGVPIFFARDEVEAERFTAGVLVKFWVEKERKRQEEEKLKAGGNAIGVTGNEENKEKKESRRGRRKSNG